MAIGGNLGTAGSSVRRRRYPLSANARLVVDREQLLTQEEDNSNLPNVPVIDPAAGLHIYSTGRIFALLSPVELRGAVPGQQVAEGVMIT